MTTKLPNPFDFDVSTDFNPARALRVPSYGLTPQEARDFGIALKELVRLYDLAQQRGTAKDPIFYRCPDDAPANMASKWGWIDASGEALHGKYYATEKAAKAAYYKTRNTERSDRQIFSAAPVRK